MEPSLTVGLLPRNPNNDLQFGINRSRLCGRRQFVQRLSCRFLRNAVKAIKSITLYPISDAIAAPLMPNRGNRKIRATAVTAAAVNRASVLKPGCPKPRKLLITIEPELQTPAANSNQRKAPVAATKLSPNSTLNSTGAANHKGGSKSRCI